MDQRFFVAPGDSVSVPIPPEAKKADERELAASGAPMDPKLFAAEGYLQEVNRKLLHGLGLHLKVDQAVGDELEVDTRPHLVVIDWRASGPGVRYAELGELETARAEKVRRERKQRQALRSVVMGFQVQPLAGELGSPERQGDRRQATGQEVGLIADLPRGGRDDNYDTSRKAYKKKRRGTR